MSWTLGGTTIPAPLGKFVNDQAETALHRTVDGQYHRDFIGVAKRVISVRWENIELTEWNLIKAEWDDQRLNGTAKTLVISELALSLPCLIEIDSFSFQYKRNYEVITASARFIEI